MHSVFIRRGRNEGKRGDGYAEGGDNYMKNTERDGGEPVSCSKECVQRNVRTNPNRPLTATSHTYVAMKAPFYVRW